MNMILLRKENKNTNNKIPSLVPKEVPKEVYWLMENGMDKIDIHRELQFTGPDYDHTWREYLSRDIQVNAFSIYYRMHHLVS